MSEVCKGEQKGHTHFRTLCCIDKCYAFSDMYFELKKIESSDRIVFYIVFKTQRPSDTLIYFRVTLNWLEVRSELKKIKSKTQPAYELKLIR